MSIDSRICLFSQRNLDNLVSRCGHFEFEDVICAVDDIELIAPEPLALFPIIRKVTNQVTRHMPIACLNPGVRSYRLHKDYDLFMAVFSFPEDLPTINAIHGWKKKCRASICWVDDVWLGEMHKFKRHFKILRNFDHILLNCAGSVKELQKITGRPCSYIAPGVDMKRFCPFPNPPGRSVDVYNMGRKSMVTHKALLEIAEKKNLFYIYDTFENMNTLLPRDHRILLANIAKRSRYFVTNIAKINYQCETHGQVEVGLRFFEGAGAGAVMIGEPPDNEPFRKYFNWEGAVIRSPFDNPSIAELLKDLDSQPERIQQIRKTNVVQSLLRHDWVYRWQDILNIVGLAPRPALEARKSHLAELAKIAATT